jgi:hypothetical protein
LDLGTRVQKSGLTGPWRLALVILATQETEIRRTAIQNQPRQIVRETLLEKTHQKKGLVKWLKVKALSSNPRTAKNKKIIMRGVKGPRKSTWLCPKVLF